MGALRGKGGAPPSRCRRGSAILTVTLPRIDSPRFEPSVNLMDYLLKINRDVAGSGRSPPLASRFFQTLKRHMTHSLSLISFYILIFLPIWFFFNKLAFLCCFFLFLAFLVFLIYQSFFLFVLHFTLKR